MPDVFTIFIVFVVLGAITLVCTLKFAAWILRNFIPLMIISIMLFALLLLCVPRQG